VLSGRGLCDELITRPEESYRLWCVVVCYLENLKNEEAITRVGLQRHRKKKIMILWPSAKWSWILENQNEIRTERTNRKCRHSKIYKKQKNSLTRSRDADG